MTDTSVIRLSIAVVCYHSPLAELQALLASLARAVEMLRRDHRVAPIALYLIDNAEESPVSLVDFSRLHPQLQELDVQLRLVAGHGNLGYGRGHNQVLRKLDSDFHLLLNPDVVVADDFLLVAIEFLQAQADILAISPHATGLDGHRQYLCKRYPSVITLLLRGLADRGLPRLGAGRIAAYEMRELPESEPSPGVPIISGCCILCRTQDFKGVNGFDSRYFLYFEDFDLSLRLSKRGQLCYLPQAKIRHGGGRAASKGLRHSLMFARSGIRFFNRHGWSIF